MRRIILGKDWEWIYSFSANEDTVLRFLLSEQTGTPGDGDPRRHAYLQGAKEVHNSINKKKPLKYIFKQGRGSAIRNS